MCNHLKKLEKGVTHCWVTSIFYSPMPFSSKKGRTTAMQKIDGKPWSGVNGLLPKSVELFVTSD